jgi:predicted DNA-binding transcriptional regulator YafY
MINPMVVIIDYTNYRGERTLRAVTPKSIEFSSNEWHSKPQWLLMAFDHEKQADRTFAMEMIHSWKQVEPDVDHKPENG